MRVPSFLAGLRTVACAIGIAALSGCGGGGSVGSGGTGAPLGVAQGTVNGFGSLIVDGVRFDDRNVPAVQEDALGRDLRVEVELGHRVEIGFEPSGAARTLRVESAVRGPVAIVSGAQFVVLGQTVRINTDPTLGPITQFGRGYESLADVLANDVVDVHGIVVPQGAGSSTIQATRVVPATGTSTWQVTGLVTAPRTGGFDVGTLPVTTGAATVLPTGRAITEGLLVRVLAPAGTPTAAGLAASRVRIITSPQAGSPAFVSGTVASLDTTARTFLVGTQRVDYANATVAPAGATIAATGYVRVRGQLAADGTLVASEVLVRGMRGEPDAELHGNVAALDPLTRRFRVRGVIVDGSGVVAQNCSAGLANGVFVEVEGRLQRNVVVATRIECEGEPSGGTVQRTGTAGSVSTDARTFVLTRPGGGSLTVAWNDATFFRDVTPQTLQGGRVEVEGVLNGDVLEASKIKRED